MPAATDPKLVRPAASEYARFFAGYVERVPENDVLSVLESQPRLLARVVTTIPVEREKFTYAPGKWTLRQLFGHLGDGERVFGFRTLAFSRADATPLPGFDENAYVENAPFATTPLADLVAEFAELRAANLRLLRRADGAAWTRSGSANQNPITVRALAYVMAGHIRHHLAVMAEKYGVAASG